MNKYKILTEEIVEKINEDIKKLTTIIEMQHKEYLDLENTVNTYFGNKLNTMAKTETDQEPKVHQITEAEDALSLLDPDQVAISNESTYSKALSVKYFENTLKKFPNFIKTGDLISIGVFPNYNSAYYSRRKNDSPKYLKSGREILYSKKSVLEYVKRKFYVNEEDDKD